MNHKPIGFIVGWLARDEDDSLWFHYSKPKKKSIEWTSDARAMELFEISADDIKWEDESPKLTTLSLI